MEHDVPEDVPVVMVPSTLEALGALAAAFLDKCVSLPTCCVPTLVWYGMVWPDDHLGSADPLGHAIERRGRIDGSCVP